MTLPVYKDRDEHLRDLLAWAEDQHARAEAGLPSAWDQGSYASRYNVTGIPEIAPQLNCGTACCIAGKVVAEAGGVFYFPSTRTYTSLVHMPGSTELVDTHGTAADILGLNRLDADILFDGGNSIDDLRRFIGILLDGKSPAYVIYTQTPMDVT